MYRFLVQAKAGEASFSLNFVFWLRILVIHLSSGKMLETVMEREEENT